MRRLPRDAQCLAHVLPGRTVLVAGEHDLSASQPVRRLREGQRRRGSPQVLGVHLDVGLGHKEIGDRPVNGTRGTRVDRGAAARCEGRHTLRCYLGQELPDPRKQACDASTPPSCTDWLAYCSSPAANRALRRWQERHAVPPVTGMDELLAAMQDRIDSDGRDRLVYRLVILGGADRDACRVVLQAVRPGLSRVASTYRAWWGWEEAASMVVAAAIERIVTYPACRVHRPAANIVADVQNRLHRARARQAREEQALGQRIAAEDLAHVAASTATSPSEELQEVVQDALETLRFSPAEAELVLAHRVRDVSTRSIAAEREQRPGTVTKHRRRAERRLQLITRSTYGLCPEVA